MQARQILGGDVSFERPGTVGDARLYSRDRGAQIDDQVGWGERLADGLIQFLVGGVVPLIHRLLQVEIAGKHLRVFVYAPVLNGRGWILDKLSVNPQPPDQEEDLSLESIGPHVPVEVG